MSYLMAPRLRPLLTPPNDGTKKGNRLDLRVALKTGAGQLLCSLDDKIELNRQINKTLEAMAQAKVIARLE